LPAARSRVDGGRLCASRLDAAWLALREWLHLAGAPKPGLLFSPTGVRLSSLTHRPPFQPTPAPLSWPAGVLLFWPIRGPRLWLADELPCGLLSARLSWPLFGRVSLLTFSQIFWLSWPSNPP
jgi:hypothetical protein